MEGLLRELVSNVLSRLPTKDLMRCKCVCKFWFDLITHPQFIENYYVFYNSREKKQQEHLLFISRRNFFSDFSTITEISILSWNPSEPKGLVSSRVLNPPPHRYEFQCEIMGPCNGIYYLTGNPGVIMNPSLNEFIALPQSHFTAPQGTQSYIYYPNFGFDPKTSDYKVVVLKDLWLDPTDPTDGPEQLIGIWTVELYSLKSNSWRILSANAITFPFQIGDLYSYAYVDTCCHWWGYVYRNDDVVECVVLSFDMTSELFRKIKVPQITQSSDRCFIDVTAFTESATIGLLVYPASQGTEICFCFDVWMMKDYWDDGSWVKQYSIGPLPNIYKPPVGFWSNQFLWKDANNRLVLYDPNCEEQIRNLRDCREFKLISVARYMESLVSLKRGIQGSSHK